jgi:hypothetical protein
MAQYVQKQCQKSGWMNVDECSDASAVGVVIRIADRQYAREPTTIDPAVIKAFQSMDAAIAFTMTSVVTSAIFRQITPNQKELKVKSRATILPIVDTFEDLMLSVSMHGLTGTAYVIRKPQLVLVWSNFVEDILSCGAAIDELLCQAVSNDVQPSQRPTKSSRSQVKIHLLLFSKLLLSKAKLVFHLSLLPDQVPFWKIIRRRLMHHLLHTLAPQQRSQKKPMISPISKILRFHPH